MASLRKEPKIIFSSWSEEALTLRDVPRQRTRIDVLEPGILTADIDEAGAVSITISDAYMQDQYGRPLQNTPWDVRTYHMGRGEGVFYYPDGSVALVLI